MDPPCLSPAPEPEPVQSLRSAELQREFFSELQGRRRRRSDDSTDSASSAPLSPASSAPLSPASLSPRSSPAQSLSSPELVAELRESRTLKPVRRSQGLTTVFCGRGSDHTNSQSGAAAAQTSANHHTAHKQRKNKPRLNQD